MNNDIHSLNVEQLRQRVAELEQTTSDLENHLNQALTKLQEQEDLLQLVILYNPNAIAVFDIDLHYMAVSERYINDYNIADQQVV
jgi:tetrahydromethanopterin S-methyltransferase subunit B